MSNAPSPTGASLLRAGSRFAARRSVRTTCCATGATSPSPSSRPRPPTETPGDGLQQAKDYAEILGLKFAYATNGHGIVEYRFPDRASRASCTTFPTPDELWARLRAGRRDHRRGRSDGCSRPATISSGKAPRYYQEIAINRAVQAILQGKRRVLLTMATGTGKTVVAFQICWKLWTSPLEPDGRAPATRASSTSPTATSWSTIRRTRLSRPSAMRATRSRARRSKSREMYFAIYQAIAEDERPAGPLPRVSRATSSTSSSSTSAIAAAPATRATGARSSSTSSRPTSSA